MKLNAAISIAIAFSIVLFMTGCKPAVDSSQGRACFTLYTVGEGGARSNDITMAKVGQEVGADISCAGKCRNNYDMNWGDGDYGEYLTHTYTAPGTFTVQYACSDRTIREQKRDKKRKNYFKGGRYESTKILTITQ